MKKLIGALFLVAYIFLTSPAQADTFNLSWDKVTLASDGTPLTELIGYRVYVSQVSGVYGPAIAAPTTEAYSYTQTTKGTYFAVVKAWNSGGESGASNEISFVVAAKLPAKPTGLKYIQLP